MEEFGWIFILWDGAINRIYSIHKARKKQPRLAFYEWRRVRGGGGGSTEGLSEW